jgi:hypothetical protein
MIYPNLAGFCGGCKEGKSTLIRYIIKRDYQNFDKIVVYSRTAMMNGDYDFLKELPVPSIIIPPSSKGVDASLTKLLKVIYDRKKRKTGREVRYLLVFDDILGCINVNSKAFSTMFSMHRHYDITAFFSYQYYCGASTLLRNLYYYVFTFQQNSTRAMKGMCEDFFPQYSLKEYKQKYGCEMPKYSFYYLNRVDKEPARLLMAPAPK